LGVIKGLKGRRMKIPEEFGIMGFANESFDEHITPTLSSVDQQTVQMGKEAFNLLIQEIKNKDGKPVINEREKIVLEPIMCFRESSGGKKL